MKRLRPKSLPTEPRRDGSVSPADAPAPTPRGGTRLRRAGRKPRKLGVNTEGIERLSRQELVSQVRGLMEELACETLRQEAEHHALLEHQASLKHQASFEYSRESYADLFEHAPMGYISLDRVGQIAHANLTAAAMLGTQRHRLLGVPLLHLVTREDRRAMLTHIWMVRNGPVGVTATVEARIHAGGQEIKGLQFTSMRRGDHAGVTVIRMALMDISARRKAEEELRVSENRFHTLANCAPALIWLSGVNEGCTWFNQPWLDFVGRTLEEEVGVGWADNVHPEDREHCLRIHHGSVQNQEEFRIEYRLRRYDGEWRWVIDHGVPLYGSGNAYVGFVGSCVDISHHRKVQETLQANQAELEIVTESTPVLLTRCTSDLNYKFVNRAYAEYLGRNPEDIIGKPICEVLSQQAFQVILPYIQAVLEGHPVEFEAEIPYPHAGTRFVHVDYMPDQDPQGRTIGWVAAITDITERKLEERRGAVRSAVAGALAEAGATSGAAATIIESLCGFAGWDAGALWQVDKERQQIECVEFWHPPTLALSEFEEDTRRQHLDPGSGLVGNVWKSGKPSHVADRAVEQRFLRSPTARKNGLSAVFGFPIKQGKRVLGVLEFYSLRARQPDQDFLDLLAVVGEKLGLFIERKQAEAALRQSEERMRHILETALDAVVAFETDGTITGWNPQAELIFGWKAAEAIGLTWVNTVIPPGCRNDHLEGLKRYLETGRGPMLEKRLEQTALHRSGREFPVELAITPLVLEDRVSFGVFVRDISERKADELALQRHADDLAAANLDLERFNRSAVGRELRMIDLKREVNELRARAGLPPRYQLDFDNPSAAAAPGQPAAEPTTP